MSIPNLYMPSDEEFAAMGRDRELRRARKAIEAQGITIPSWWPPDATDTIYAQKQRQIANMIHVKAPYYIIDHLRRLLEKADETLSPFYRCEYMEDIHAAYAEGIPCPPNKNNADILAAFPFIPNESPEVTETRRDMVACAVVRQWISEQEASPPTANGDLGGAP